MRQAYCSDTLIALHPMPSDPIGYVLAATGRGFDRAFQTLCVWQAAYANRMHLADLEPRILEDVGLFRNGAGLKRVR